MATPNAALTGALPAFRHDQGLEYYAGRPELLDWLGRLLELPLTSIHQARSNSPTSCRRPALLCAFLPC
jgi:hypothetical protein